MWIKVLKIINIAKFEQFDIYLDIIFVVCLNKQYWGWVHQMYLAWTDWMWLPDKSNKLLTSAGSRDEGRLELEHECGGGSIVGWSHPLLASPMSLPAPLSSAQSSSSSSTDISSFTTCTQTMPVNKTTHTSRQHEQRFRFSSRWNESE